MRGWQMLLPGCALLAALALTLASAPEGPACKCGRRSFVRSLEEDEFGFPANVEPLAETREALLGQCRSCGAWWERVPHEVYGYAWYRTEQRYWDASAQPPAIANWAARRREQGL